MPVIHDTADRTLLDRKVGDIAFYRDLARNACRHVQERSDRVRLLEQRLKEVEDRLKCYETTLRVSKIDLNGRRNILDLEKH